MKKTEVMKRLEAAGTAQNCKIYARHGVTGKMFGVSYANLGKLVREIGTDHALARELFDTGNHDARVLATMIADPAKTTAAQLADWGKACDNHVISWAIARIAAGSPSAVSMADKWTRARGELLSATGWNVVAVLADREDLPDDWFAEHLETIEAKIHASRNRVRYSMNTALIALGCRPALTKAATAAAKRIGRVEVDHGETGCKTPDAASYIAKTVAHRRKKAARKAGKKAPARKQAPARKR